jgi:nucleoside-diphosphate-sugar epimerase
MAQSGALTWPELMSSLATSSMSSLVGTSNMLGGGPVVYIEPRIEPRRTLADISLAKKLLNWQPTIKLPEGIEELKRLHSI